MNELEKLNKQKKAAYLAGRDAIVKRLGKNATNEMVMDVIELLVHLAVTDGYKHNVSLSMHNLEVFNKNLSELIQESQKNIKTKDCSLLM
ncbi:MAG: hypothetical protein WAW61_17630 [Methylococcaceae bacterium]